MAKSHNYIVYSLLNYAQLQGHKSPFFWGGGALFSRNSLCLFYGDKLGSGDEAKMINMNMEEVFTP